MLECSAILAGKKAAIAVDADASIADVNTQIKRAFDIPEDGLLKIILKGKNLNNLAPDAKAADAGLASNSKLMIMLTKQDEKKLVEEAKGERMRGFEDDDRLRSGRGLKTSGGGASAAAASARRSEPTYRFHAIAALPMLPEGAKPEKKAAEALLKQLSTDKAILSIMQQHKWSVGRLSEMPPEGKVGVSDSCLMGLNKNAGQEILLRLRTDDWQGLRPYDRVIDVLLHELTHNVWGDHDDNFKQLNSQLKKEYREYAATGQGRALDGGAVFSRQSADDDAVMAVDEGRVLGGGLPAAATAAAGADDAEAMDVDVSEAAPVSAKEAAARAAAARAAAATTTGSTGGAAAAASSSPPEWVKAGIVAHQSDSELQCACGQCGQCEMADACEVADAS